MIWVILGIIVLIVLFLVLTYNGMVKARNKVDEAWSGIDVQLKRRHDLIPNLVETVKGYAAHESEVFENVSAARSAAISATRPGRGRPGGGRARPARWAACSPSPRPTRSCARPRASPSCSASWRTPRTRSPARAASTTATCRRTTRRSRSFPNSLLAGPFGFTRREFFEIEDPADREPVKVSF